MPDSQLSSHIVHIQRVTFAQIMSTVMIATLLVVGAVLFEVKTSYFTKLLIGDLAKPAQFQLTGKGKQLVEQFAKQHANLAVVSIVNVNMRQNSQTSIIRVFNDPALQKSVAQQDAVILTADIPLFTTDGEQNIEITTLLNGEFSCTQYGPGGFVRQYKLEPVIKMTCSVPVPPYYGKLTGLLIMYSTTQLTIYDVTKLKRDAIKLSVQLYSDSSMRIDPTRKQLKLSE